MGAHHEMLYAQSGMSSKQCVSLKIKIEHPVQNRKCLVLDLGRSAILEKKGW